MNLILFKEPLKSILLPENDPRARHIRKVLRMKPGDELDVGVANGPLGKASIHSDDMSGILLEFKWLKIPQSDGSLHLGVGLPRPQTARKILRDAAGLGLEKLTFFSASRSDPSYAKSKLWSSGEWHQQLWEGAELAFTTHLPDVTMDKTLVEWLRDLPEDTSRLALDNYEAKISLSSVDLNEKPTVLAVGPERGWESEDRNLLRRHGFNLVSMGRRVLRTETACVSAVAIVASRTGIW